MGLFHKTSDSAALVSGMMERVGADLSHRLETSPDAASRSFASMVARCTHCTRQDACRQLQEDNLLLDTAPEYCRNKDVMRRR